MSIAHEGFERSVDTLISKLKAKVKIDMAVKPDITVGNIISTSVSLIAIGSVIVTITFYGATLRSDVDRNTKDIATLQSQAVAQQALNADNLKLMTEMNTHLTYMKEAIDRIEKRGQ